MEAKKPFTKQEKKVMDSLVKANKEFKKLDGEYETAFIDQWESAMYQLQAIMMQRVAKRDYPKYFKQV